MVAAESWEPQAGEAPGPRAGKGREYWGWVYRFDESFLQPRPFLRSLLKLYYHPNRVERWKKGFVYRLLGVHRFGQVIPTGGVRIRRATGARMAPYTLAGTSVGAARVFLMRTCIFETLHLPFAVFLLVRSWGWLSAGRVDLALNNLVINLLVNLYPILHHRHTRVRIVAILGRSKRIRETVQSLTPTT